MEKLKVIILAAGKGTRMKSDRPKVLFEVAGRAMIDYVIDLSEQLNPEETVVIIGSGAEEVKEHLKNRKVTFVEQKEQLGTGHAVMQARCTLIAMMVKSLFSAVTCLLWELIL